MLLAVAVWSWGLGSLKCAVLVQVPYNICAGAGLETSLLIRKIIPPWGNRVCLNFCEAEFFVLNGAESGTKVVLPTVLVDACGLLQ